MSEIDEIKARLDIVDVIGGYVQLQKAGRSYKAVCPFHSERTPSFIVSPERQSWHCFGACGEGGDVFSFVMKKEGLEFREALRLLAERAGVALPERHRAEEDTERERLRQANEAAAQYYHRLLLDGEEGRRARRYLEERGLDRATLQVFQLGFAPSGWETLLRHLRERGYRQEELLTAGLITIGERGPRDLFHERIMFPISDIRGRVVGFGGRTLPNEGQPEAQPKYLNTAQTALFDKGSLLYGLDKAKDYIRREGLAVIVEGYMDAIAAHQHGYANVVASMGTALTERQVRLLKRFTSDLVLALDADPAGVEAALRAIEYQEILGRDIRVAVLPPGLDPDEAIRRQPDSWPALLAGAQPLLDYKFQAVAAGLEGARPWERSRAVDELLPLVGLIGDRIVQAHYLQRVARLAQVREAELQSALGRLLRQSTKRRPAVTAAPVAPAAAAHSGDAREEFCLALLLRYPELREDGLALSPELFWHTENRQVLEAWQGCEETEELAQVVPEELEGHLQRVSSVDLPPFKPAEAKAALRDCVGRLKQRELEAIKQASSTALAAREAEDRTTEEELAAAAAAWQAGSVPSDVPAESASGGSPVAALLRDTEMGLRLHQDSKMEQDEEDQRYTGAEKVENG
jgi:DNA primase